MRKKICAALAALMLGAAGLPGSAAAADPGVQDSGAIFEGVLFHKGSPTAVLRDKDGSYLVTDALNKVIWRAESGKPPTVLVGRSGAKDQTGEAIGGYNDGSYAEAAFLSLWAITPFGGGYLVSDPDGGVIRWFGSGSVKTAAGSGQSELKDGRGVAAAFSNPTGLAADDDGNVYIADTGSHRIRRMDKDGNVTTAAGTGESGGYADGPAEAAVFNAPTGLAWRGGALYIADTGNHRIRMFADGQVTTLAGAGYDQGSDAYYGGDYLDGPAGSARFSAPTGVAAGPDGTVYVSDTGNGAVRQIQSGQVTTVIKSDADAGDPFPVAPGGLLADSAQRLLICDAFAGVVFSPPFTDTKGHWAKSDIDFAARQGLLTGTSMTEFSPDTAITRGMFITALGRFSGADMSAYTTSGFSDVRAGAYYLPYVEWAAAHQIVSASGVGGGRFDPGRSVTREEMAVMMYNYANAARYALPVSPDSGAFADGADISAWALDAVQAMRQAGIIGGKPGNLFDPKGGATRAEAAAILRRFLGLAA
ncbi:MAG: S-layer homology domain-containing protein [Peptococcaceae bacterium]|jgi:sugar lactone lactonase YvrE|nr:S-layer homology domain-containing protein [Peptococcaceae bacterium]